MPDEQENPSATSDPPSDADKFFEHLEVALKHTLNLQFEEAQFDLRQMQSLADSMTEEDKSLAEPLVQLLDDFVVGNMQLAVAETKEDRQAALVHLKAAKEEARTMLVGPSALANNPGLFQMALGIDAQVISIQMRIAREHGDTKEVERLEAQSEAVFNSVLEPLPPDDPMRHFLLGCKAIKDAIPKFVAGIGAAEIMNLDLAQQYLRESSEGFLGMNEHFQKAEINAVMLQSSARIGEGYRLLAGALDNYVTILYAAIIGDVSKPDVERLKEAERNALEGADLILKGAGAAPGLFPVGNMKGYAEVLSTLSRNLRALCERSLSPKEISRSASPRALIYFLGTFLVLIVALPLTGVVQKLDSPTLVFLVVVSIVISLISTFGFESIRLIPWLNALVQFVPGSSKAADKAPPKK